MTSQHDPDVGFVADTMVLAMFIDSGQVDLLTSLGAGSVHVPLSVIDPAERPPFLHQPIAELAKGVFVAQRDQGRPGHATRIARRTAFYSAVGASWHPAELTNAELRLAQHFMSAESRLAARTINPDFRFKRINAGEAECAAVAVARGWTLWSDDAAIVQILAALHPTHPVERIGNLLVRAVDEGLISCPAAADLYNLVFKQELGLWTTLTLTCRGGRLGRV